MNLESKVPNKHEDGSALKFMDIFLKEEDIPGFKKIQSRFPEGPEKDRDAYIKTGCLGSGFQVWVSEDDPTARFVDIRWIFKDNEMARLYHRLAWRINSEGMPIAKPDVLNKVSHKTLTDGDQHILGYMEFVATDPFGLGMKMTLILLVLKNVVVKLFFASIDPERMAALLEKAMERVRAYSDKIELPPSTIPPPVINERWPKGERGYEVLAGSVLTPGRGICSSTGECILGFDHYISDMYSLIGGGDEDMRNPFVYYFNRGMFGLNIKGVFDKKTGKFNIVRIYYYDDPYAQLKTEKGVSILTDEQKIIKVYGQPSEIKESAGIKTMRYDGIVFYVRSSGIVEMIELLPF
ncbi:MAG: hypothetical protein QW728_04390 [Thermoplasmata archaeon]